MALATGELARWEADRLEVRSDAMRLSWRLDGLSCADQHDLVCRFDCAIRAADPMADRRMLRETFLTRQASVGAEQIVEHFTPALRSAAAAWTKKHNGEDCLTEDARGRLTEALRSAANSVAFACGLELLPPWKVEIDSPSLRRQKADAVLRSRHLERLKDTGELIKQFEAVRQSLPNGSAGKLLEQLNPADRGSVLQALLLAGQKQSDQCLYAVAGPNLIRIDAGESFTTTLIALPQTLGPLRSVQSADVDGQQRLLIGARGGVLFVDPANPQDARAYADPIVRSELGFNRAVYLSHRSEIWASHSDAGLVAWDIGQPAEPKARFEQFGRIAEADGARHLNAIDSRSLIFADGPRCVMGIDPPEGLDAQSPADITAILPRAGRSIIVHADGLTVSLDHETGTFTKVSHHPGRYVTAAAMPFFDEIRVLLSDENGAIDCVGIDDSLVTRYCSPYRGMKILTASRSIVAGISSDRQRLILWNTWDAQSPMQEIYLYAQTHHRIADIDFV